MKIRIYYLKEKDQTILESRKKKAKASLDFTEIMTVNILWHFFLHFLLSGERERLILNKTLFCSFLVSLHLLVSVSIVHLFFAFFFLFLTLDLGDHSISVHPNMLFLWLFLASCTDTFKIHKRKRITQGIPIYQRPNFNIFSSCL